MCSKFQTTGKIDSSWGVYRRGSRRVDERDGRGEDGRGCEGMGEVVGRTCLLHLPTALNVSSILTYDTCRRS